MGATLGKTICMLGVLHLPIMAAAEGGVALFHDPSWSGIVLIDNCRMGQFEVLDDRVAHTSHFLRFSLEDGDVGTCSSDANARNGARFWERAELRQLTTLKRDTRYHISFSARFLEGLSGRNETIWQLHIWHPNCPLGPPLRLAFDDGRLTLRQLDPDQTFHTTMSNIRLQDLGIEWHRFDVQFGTHDQSHLDIQLNGQTILTANFEIPDCGQPHMKFGIYRPAAAPGRSNAPAVWDLANLHVSHAD